MRWSIAPTDEFVGVWIPRPTGLWVSGFLILSETKKETILRD